MSAADDLSGRWTGMFSYPHSAPPTQFEATLHDANGVLTGETVEPDLVDPGLTRRACLDGRRDDYDIVAYEGEVAADGVEIHGRWTIPGIWSGTFLMIRDAGATVAEHRKVGETVR
jgi:hypothetical protein